MEQDDSEAEAHWGIVLCKYGIEYVEDPKTLQRIPTCHRTSFDAVTTDADYLAAIDYSDAMQQRIYEAEARAIDKIQKDILAIVKNEKPFDVFICYKETDESGKRTIDSAIANDIYYQLTQQGFKVFFAAITLEDKLGQDYEPYIFAALNSAKVMLVLGTKPEYFNAVWVKNEWSRFLHLMKSDRSKLLIPCYRDMDAYDLPEEFAHMQAQDMGKIGFINDVVRGIQKVVVTDEPKTTVVKEAVVTSSEGTNTAPLLRRVFMFLEDGDWSSADEYCEKVLDMDPENAEAYLGKLLAELRIRTREQLCDAEYRFDDSSNYQKILRFGDEKLETEMRGYISQCLDKAEVCQQKASAVACALKKGVTKSDPTLEERLAATKTKVEFLERILNVFDATQSQIQALQREFNAAISREKQLADQRSRLGLFAGKEKKRIDEELASVSAKKSDLAARIEQNQKTIGKYSSTSDVEHDLKEARNSVNDLEVQIESARKNADKEYSFEEALDIYLNQTDVAAAVNAIYPAATFISVIYGKTNTVKFGKYVQKNNCLPEPIEWLLLAKEENKALVISKYALDCQQYNTSSTYVTWETCSLRKWLNNDFINAAFSKEEKALIPTVTVPADINPDYYTYPGKATQDQVFLLSIAEANKYFGSDSARQCRPTDYTVANGAYVNSDNGNCWWWLRSPGVSQRSAANVRCGGDVYEYGSSVSHVNNAVRPALWIDLS
ncbi:MAG: TIR domain-containing protein [Oscillospiraceae bacterium]|nr:TIR domain-containing protein [Oscillospiraceae bacterium]